MVLKLQDHQNQEKSHHNTSFSAQKTSTIRHLTDMVFNTYFLIIVDSFILLQHVTQQEYIGKFLKVGMLPWKFVICCLSVCFLPILSHTFVPHAAHLCTPLCPMLQLTSHLVRLDRCVMEVSLLSAKKGCFISALKHAHKTLITESDFISDLHLSAPSRQSLLALNYLLSHVSLLFLSLLLSHLFSHTLKIKHSV